MEEKKITIEITEIEGIIKTNMTAVGFVRLEVLGAIADFLMEYSQKSRKEITNE